MNKIIQHKQVISEIRKLNDLLCEVEIKDISDLSKYGRKGEPLKANKYFIVHHTASGGNAERVVSILNNRKNKKTGQVQPLGIQYVIDREGKVFRTLPSGSRGAHILDSDDFGSAPKGINNSNSQGVEVIGMNDEDILPSQALATLKLVKQLGFKPDQIYGHGTINPGHKSPSEGMTIKNFIDKNYNVEKEYDYDYSDFPISERPHLKWEDMTDSEIEGKIENMIKDVGVENIAKVSTNSDCESFLNDIEKLFGVGYIEKSDNFCESKFMGIPVIDYVNSAEEVKKQIEKEDEEAKKKEEEEAKKKEEEEAKKKEEEKESSLTEELINFKRFIK